MSNGQLTDRITVLNLPYLVILLAKCFMGKQLDCSQIFCSGSRLQIHVGWYGSEVSVIKAFKF